MNSLSGCFQSLHGGELQEKTYTRVCFRLGMHFSYALIAERDAGRHTVIYNCLYHVTKKGSQTAVMEQMDRAFNIESLYQLL